jgi:hypothetical protein
VCSAQECNPTLTLEQDKDPLEFRLVPFALAFARFSFRIDLKNDYTFSLSLLLSALSLRSSPVRHTIVPTHHSTLTLTTHVQSNSPGTS